MEDGHKQELQDNATVAKDMTGSSIQPTEMAEQTNASEDMISSSNQDTQATEMAEQTAVSDDSPKSRETVAECDARKDMTSSSTQPTEMAEQIAASNDPEKNYETVAECDAWYTSRKKQLEKSKQELIDRKARISEHRNSCTVLAGRVSQLKASFEKRDQQRKREMEERGRGE